MISLIIPTLNEEQNLRTLLGEPEMFADCEVIVMDGGSVDGTGDVARQAGADLYVTSLGRGGQLALGAEKTTGDWLLFLHADCRLPLDWRPVLDRHRTQNPDKALVFSLRLDDDSLMARLLEAIVRWRCRLLALPYGDQGLFISRTLYDQVGGFSSMVLMEDVDLVRRLGRKRIVFSSAVLTTSAIRYQKNGYFRRMMRNALCLTLYFLGMPLERIKKLYG
ncbi:TIGR04283 family arsenosugar biosynthesis glycosyltransferase [Emcibacter sp.]|uniref:TIGR04283 family arsenosugar biosynthesis glycosyltransferase n=1 Tax=Emcibacter sp. TaxID=1979954 RepID=UPI003A8D498B